MKTCLIFLIGLLPFLTLAQPATTVEDTVATTNQPSTDPQYDIQIQNGNLLLDPLKKRVNVAAVWGKDAASYGVVEPTVENVVKYLRAANTNLTIVVSPGAADVKIGDLKFRSWDLSGLMQAFNIATDGAIAGRPLIQRGAGFYPMHPLQHEGTEWALVATLRKHETSTLEAFNLSGYIQTLGLGNNPPPAVIQRKVDEIKDVILNALRQLHPNGYSSSEEPKFRYHEGTRLLIVTGDPEAIEISSKIVNALSGQQKNGTEKLESVDLLDTNPPASQN